MTPLFINDVKNSTFRVVTFVGEMCIQQSPFVYGYACSTPYFRKFDCLFVLHVEHLDGRANFCFQVEVLIRNGR
jgi:hypothetical protein